MPLAQLPVRAGERPETGPSVPHVQFTQTSPPELRQELKEWMATALPGTVTGPSEISDARKMRAWIAANRPDVPLDRDLPDENAFAVFLHDVPPADDALLLPPRLTSELAHLHPDGSLHLALSRTDQDELIRNAWAERHPLYSAQVNVILLYGPRTHEELDLARQVVTASYEYATGRSCSISSTR